MMKKLCSSLYKATIIKSLFYINHRIYMRMYIKWLKKKGAKILGSPRYIGYHVVFDDFSKISIGNNTTISDDCHLLTHDYSITNAFRSTGNFDETKGDIAIVRDIKIGNNCFIGKKTILLPGTCIGDDCIIGAGSVVRGTIPSRSVIIGNPGVIIGNVDELSTKWQCKLNNIESNSYCIKQDNHR